MTLDADQLRRAYSLFARAEDLDDEALERLLSGEGDPEVVQEVRELLAEAAAMPDATELSDGSGGAQLASRVGQTIGPYRLVSELGRGGMGVVYLAERQDGQFEQRVAIKILRGALETEEMVERFKHERQVLAHLNHPGIAKLLEGGTEDGLPYIVMELIEGEPIDGYCDRLGLEVRERLELFARVCDAVAHAHQNLLVHRDLKPSNILVTAAGDPKLLDFGIAKPVDAGLSATVTRINPMTPDFASPEQVRGERVTTATDVYQLGALLYLLLVGRAPFAGADTTPLKRLQAVLDEPPERPSRAATRPGRTDAATGGVVASAPDPRRLGRRLRGDLDQITLKALRKAPENRYASVPDLADDVRRYLEGRPVLASGYGLGYSFSKLVQRNKAATAALTLLALSLTAGVGATAWQARVARAEARVAEEERSKAESTLDFLEGVLSAGDTAWFSKGGLGRDATIAEVLAAAGERADTELLDQPEVRAKVHRLLGSTYVTRSEFALAEKHLQTAIELQRPFASPGDPEFADAESLLGRCYFYSGRFEEAEALMRGIVDRRDQLGPIEVVATATNDAAWLAYRAGRIEEARNGFNDSIALLTEIHGTTPHAARAISRAALGVTYQEVGDLDSAARAFVAALDEIEAIGGRPLPESGTMLGTLAGVREAQGKLTEAEDLYRRAIDRYIETWGEDHSDTAAAVAVFGRMLVRLDRVSEARSSLQRATGILTRTVAENHPEWFRVNLLEAELQVAEGRPEEAEATLRASLASHAARYGEESTSAARTRASLARCLLELGQFEEAEELFRQSLAAYDSTHGPDSFGSTLVRRDLERLVELRAAS